MSVLWQRPGLTFRKSSSHSFNHITQHRQTITSSSLQTQRLPEAAGKGDFMKRRLHEGTRYCLLSRVWGLRGTRQSHPVCPCGSHLPAVTGAAHLPASGSWDLLRRGSSLRPHPLKLLERGDAISEPPSASGPAQRRSSAARRLEGHAKTQPFHARRA